MRGKCGKYGFGPVVGLFCEFFFLWFLNFFFFSGVGEWLLADWFLRFSSRYNDAWNDKEKYPYMHNETEEAYAPEIR